MNIKALHWACSQSKMFRDALGIPDGGDMDALFRNALLNAVPPFSRLPKLFNKPTQFIFEATEGF
jgi:hypothetical protein